MNPVRVLIEGLDGAGKTEAISALASYLDRNKVEYFVVREPGSTALAEELRGRVSSGEFSDEPEVEMLMFLTARASTNRVINRHIKEGHVVLCDRGSPSTYAYQVNTELTEELWEGTHKALEPKVPTLRILLTCDYVTMRTRKGKAKEYNALDDRAASPESFQQMAIAYRSLDWDLVLDTSNMSKVEVSECLIKLLEDYNG